MQYLSEQLVISTFLKAHKNKEFNLEQLYESGINASWFEDKLFKKIFEIFEIFKNTNRKYDEVMVGEYLKKSDIKNYEDVMLELLMLNMVPQNIVLEHINMLKDSYHYKQLKALSAEIIKQSDEKEEVANIITMAENSLKDFNFLSSFGYARNLNLVREERLKEPIAKRIKTDIPFIDTVLTDDEGNSGILSEGLFYISGLKESGKTFILTRIIENVSRESKVLFGSMEFGKKLYDKNIAKAQQKGYFNGNLENILVFDDIYDVRQIIAEIKFQKKINDIKLVALDSMLRMTNSNGSFYSNEERLSNMFSLLAKCSRELQIPIIIIVQSAKEDLKSSIVSVKGAINADHEAFCWIHIYKTFFKNNESEQRTVLWVKNKDTHKHPKQNLMFVPQTSDFYRCEVDERGVATKAIDNYRIAPSAPQVCEVVYDGKSFDIPIL